MKIKRNIYRGRQQGKQQQSKSSGIQHKQMSNESEQGQISGQNERKVDHDNPSKI